MLNKWCSAMNLQQETPILRLMDDCEFEDVICQIQSAKYCQPPELKHVAMVYGF